MQSLRDFPRRLIRGSHIFWSAAAMIRRWKCLNSHPAFASNSRVAHSSRVLVSASRRNNLLLGLGRAGGPPAVADGPSATWWTTHSESQHGLGGPPRPTCQRPVPPNPADQSSRRRDGPSRTGIFASTRDERATREAAEPRDLARVQLYD